MKVRQGGSTHLVMGNERVSSQQSAVSRSRQPQQSAVSRSCHKRDQRARGPVLPEGWSHQRARGGGQAATVERPRASGRPRRGAHLLLLGECIKSTEEVILIAPYGRLELRLCIGGVRGHVERRGGRVEVGRPALALAQIDGLRAHLGKREDRDANLEGVDTIVESSRVAQVSFVNYHLGTAREDKREHRRRHRGVHRGGHRGGHRGVHRRGCRRGCRRGHRRGHRRGCRRGCRRGHRRGCRRCRRPAAARVSPAGGMP